MSNKEAYRQLYDNNPTIPIFSSPWWLDAVTEDNWDVILVHRNGEIAGALPYYVKQKYGMTYATLPQFTQTGGLWINKDLVQRPTTQLAYEWEIANAAIEELEGQGLAFYRASFYHTINNWQAFCWRGYKQTTRYTYRLEDLSDLDNIFLAFSKSTRKDIRKASSTAVIAESDDIALFYKLVGLVYERQGISIPFSFEKFARLDKSCVANGARLMLIAQDHSGKVHSAIYVVWDSMSAYLLMSGTDPAFRSSNFKTLLVWEAIQRVAALNIAFDFEGSMMQPVAEYFRKFGAMPTPYHFIWKAYNLPARLYFGLRNLV